MTKDISISMYKELFQKCVDSYNEDLIENPENTDAIMFILEEVANEEGFNEKEFLVLSKLVYEE